MSFEPREYQVKAVRSVIDGYQLGKRQLLLRLPTGAGKTVISALLIEQLRPLIGERSILFLAHRREIIDQTAEKIIRQIGAEHVTIEQAERRAERGRGVVVASIQTLLGRLSEYQPTDFAAVIVDECHHAYAKTWMQILDHFGSAEDSLLLGLTATPRRSDGLCATTLFKETAFEISLGELQEQGYLVPMDYYTVEASLGLADLSTDQSGDFQISLLGKIMNSPELRQLTVRACLEKARGRKTIAFCASVEHARDLAQDFVNLGIRAAAISGESPNRDQIIEEFRQGQIEFLSNFGVLIEGFDDPSIECVLLARPTTSPLVYSQCIGRGLRSHPGKRACIIIDIIDRQRQQLQYNAFEAVGLKRSWRGSGRDPLREAEAIARIRVTDPIAFLKIREALSLEDTQAILMGLDPNTVIAGIDGMPLMLYQKPAAGTLLPVDEALELLKSMLAEALFNVSSASYDEGLIRISLQHTPGRQISPYLAWQLEEASGHRIKLDLLEQEPQSLDDDDAFLLELLRPQQPETAPSPATITQESAPRQIDKALPLSSLDLKARLNKLTFDARQQAKTETAAPAAEAEKAIKTPSKSLSMQERLKAIKADYQQNS